MPVKKCECCGEEFKARLTKIRTCSLVCRNRLISKEKAERHIKRKSCVVCDAEFDVGGSEWDRETCSKICQYKLTASKTTKSISKSCPVCATELKVRPSDPKGEDGENYCSRRCYSASRKIRTARPCGNCGSEFSTPPSQLHVKTCSTECGYKLYSGPARYGYRGITELVIEHGVKRSRRTRFGAVLHDTRRRATELRATPSWANHEKIKAICEAAASLQKATGDAYHVDHIVPLRGKTVCGLHWEGNLQILPALENILKGNRKWPDKP